MRVWHLAFVLVALIGLVGGCRSPSLPGDGDGGGGAVDMARAGDAGRPCAVLCAMGLTCCDGACVNLRNDIHNCGSCGNACSGAQPYCNGTACAPAPCSPACDNGTLCCDVQGPGPSRGPACTAPTDGGTCPLGCPLCV